MASKRLVACAAFFLLFGAGAASAATYTVTTLGDSAGTCSGTSPNFSCTTLRAAITAANATVGVADTIQFSVAGTINITSALPIVTDTLTINGSGLTLNGGGGAYGAIWFVGAGASGSQLLNTTITNFNERTVWAQDAANITISNNAITMPNNNNDAIRCLSADNCTVINNTINGGFYGISLYNQVTIAGYTGTVTGNIVNGTQNGIGLSGVGNVVVDGNTITGSGYAGIRVTRQWDWNVGQAIDNNQITNNTISGGVDGIVLEWYPGVLLSTINNTLIQGNTITGNTGHGIRLTGDATMQIDRTVITGNTITGNGGDGVAIAGANTTTNFIAANSISGNGGLGIDLNNDGVTANDAGDGDTGPNGLQNFPVLTGATTGSVNFTLDTSANANGYRIDFYNNPGGVDPTGFGEGQTWLGSCIVASPSATVPTTCSIAGVDPATVRMTATRCLTAACTSGSTSEFSGPAVTDLRITKTDGVTTYSPGQSLTYTIKVTNAGTTTVFNALFTDPAVTGLTVSSVTCGSATAGSQCPTAANTTVALMQGSGIVIPTLAAGGSVTFTVTATVSATMTGNLTNTATIAPPSGVTESVPADNTAADTDARLPNFGTCDARMFLTQSPNGSTPTTLYDIGTSTNPFIFASQGTGSVTYNATGYNPADNYLYAIQSATNHLLRIGADGSTTDLGAVSGMASTAAGTLSYRSGTFDDTGSRYFVIDGNATNTVNISRLYVIDVTTKTATFVTLSQPIGDDIADMAYVNGMLYSVTQAGQLISINPTTGTVTNIGPLNGVTNGQFFGAMFGAPNGLFGVLNNGAGFYQIDLATGAVTLISEAPSSNSNDGANCAAAPIAFGADLQVTKTNTPAQGPNDLTDDTYLLGETRTYTLVVSNPGPFGAQNVTVSDPLPAGISTANWTCASTAGNARCGAASSSGAINDVGADLPVGGSLTYTLTLTVPADYTGDLVNTVTVTPGAATTDPTPGNNTATDTDTVTQTDVQVVKTVSPATAVASGTVVTYTLTVTNNGPADVTNAVLTDTASAGLDCTTPSTTLTCSASGGASCPGATVPVSDLLGAGVTIPVLPAGGQVVATLQCTVTASGM